MMSSLEQPQQQAQRGGMGGGIKPGQDLHEPGDHTTALSPGKQKTFLILPHKPVGSCPSEHQEPSHDISGLDTILDNFYTSPKLCLDLASMKFGACGTYRDNRKGYPSGRANALTRKSKRDTVRWIREDPLLFVRWMDTQEVAVSGGVVQRRVKVGDGHWAVKNIPCPSPIIVYNKNMGGVDLSDQLIQYYSTHRETAPWYCTLFLHLVDTATTNAHILH
eukprot:superscaffoldBa00011358_g25181